MMPLLPDPVGWKKNAQAFETRGTRRLLDRATDLFPGRWLKCDNRSSSIMVTSLTSVSSPEIIRQHGLTPEEYEKIKQLLGGREPTITELGIFSVMWSEHCSYKSSRVHLRRLPTR